MENQNPNFDDIYFEILLAKEGDNFFAQEEDGHISGVDSKKKVSVSFNEY